MRHLVAPDGQVVGTRELCEVSAAVTGLNGAGITVRRLRPAIEGEYDLAPEASNNIYEMTVAERRAAGIESKRSSEARTPPESWLG